MDINFSICLIARNEEKTLPRMVASLKEFQERGGEILLLDTGSTDNTADVAESLGCIVYKVGDKFKITIDKYLAKDINYKFVTNSEAPVVHEGDTLFDFASARNYVADFSKNDMIATPDCDEVWTKFNLDRIQKEIADGAEQFEYNFVFSHDELGNPVIKFMHSKFYNRKKFKWVGIIHEVLSGGGKTVFLDESICKLEHWQNPETNRTGYLKGLAVDCWKNPDNDRNSHYFAREMMYNARFQSAIQEFKRHISMNRWDQENAQSMLYVGDCYEHLGQIEEAFKWWSKAIGKCPNKREPLMRFAEYYWKNGQAQQSILYAEAALLIKQAPFYANFQPYYEHVPHEILYWAYWNIGDKEKSKEHFDKARAYAPHNPKYLDAMRFYYPGTELPKVSILLPTLNRKEGLHKCLRSIQRLNYPQHLLQVMVKEGEGTVPSKIAEMLEQADGEYICYAADDMEFSPDSLYIAVNESKELKKGLVSFNAGPVLSDEGNICEHFIIKRDIIKSIGGAIFDTEFNHVGVDNLLWAQCKVLGEAYHSEKAIITHNHFSKGAEIDDTYKKAWGSVETDRALLKTKLEFLKNGQTGKHGAGDT